MENKIKRQFAALVANMLDAEARQSWEEYDAFKRKVNEWQEKFSLDIERDKDATKSYNYCTFSAIPELRTNAKTPTWFKGLVGTIRDVFGVGVLLDGATNATIITDNADLIIEINEFAETVQRQMLLYYRNNLKIRSKPQYFKGFVSGVYQKLQQSNSTALILKSRSERALDWYKEETQIKTETVVNKTRCTEDYYAGIHDGQHRGQRLSGIFGQKQLSS